MQEEKGVDEEHAADQQTKESKTAGSLPQPLTQEWRLPFSEDWLQAFYKECGREITLAYTTLNQMKNWAMLVAAAAISGLAFGTSADKYPNLPMLIGVVIVYTFTLRFFIRAILCYINLSRWNTLQSDCLQLMFVAKEDAASTAMARPQLAEKLARDVQQYYYQWLSPYSRKNQVLQNLKLGFALLFALPLFFMLWGIVALWENHLVQGLAFFALGDTAVELNDYFKSRFFDDVRAQERKKAWGKFYEIFPVPASHGWFVGSWVGVLLISVTISTRTTICSWVVDLVRRLCQV